MKKINFLTITVVLVFCTFTPFSSAEIAIGDDPDKSNTFWVVTTEPVPYDIDGMTLFWGIELWEDNPTLEFNVYRPEGYDGPVYDKTFMVDLTPFEGKTVIFEFTSSEGFTKFLSNAYLFPEDPSYPPDFLNDYGEFPGPFYFGFYRYNYDDDPVGWE